MTSKTKYYCRQCNDTKLSPERPLTAARLINTGCGSCGYITRHKGVGMA